MGTRTVEKGLLPKPRLCREDSAAKLTRGTGGHLLPTEQAGQGRLRQRPLQAERFGHILGALRFQGPLILDSEARPTSSQLQRTPRHTGCTLCLKQHWRLPEHRETTPLSVQAEGRSRNPPGLLLPAVW